MKYSIFTTVLLAASAASALSIPRQEPQGGAPDAVVAPADVNAPVNDPNAPVNDPNSPVNDPNAPVNDPNAPANDPNANDPNANLPENSDPNATPGVPAPGTPAPGTPAPGTPAPGTPAPGTPAPVTPEPEEPEPEEPEPEEPEAGAPAETEDPNVAPGGDDVFPPNGEIETVAIDRDDFYRVYKFVKKLVRTGDYASLVALQVLTDEALDLFDDEGAPEIQGGPGSFDNNGASYHSPGGLHQSKRTVNNSGGGFRGFGGAFGRIG